MQICQDHDDRGAVHIPETFEFKKPWRCANANVVPERERETNLGPEVATGTAGIAEASDSLTYGVLCRRPHGLQIGLQGLHRVPRLVLPRSLRRPNRLVEYGQGRRLTRRRTGLKVEICRQHRQSCLRGR